MTTYNGLQPFQPMDREQRNVNGQRQVQLGSEDVVKTIELINYGRQHTSSAHYILLARTSSGNIYRIDSSNGSVLDLRTLQQNKITPTRLVACSDLALGQQLVFVSTTKDLERTSRVTTSPVTELVVVEETAHVTQMPGVFDDSQPSDPPFPIVAEFKYAYQEARRMQDAAEIDNAQ